MGWIWPFCVWTTLNLTRLVISMSERFVSFFPISYHIFSFHILAVDSGIYVWPKVLSRPNYLLQQVLCTSKTVHVPPIQVPASSGLPTSTTVSKSVPTSHPPEVSTVPVISFPSIPASPSTVAPGNNVIEHTSHRPTPQPTDSDLSFCDEL